MITRHLKRKPEGCGRDGYHSLHGVAAFYEFNGAEVLIVCPDEWAMTRFIGEGTKMDGVDISKCRPVKVEREEEL